MGTDLIMKNNQSTQRPLHPFPARMAPEIAFEALSSLPEESLVLDPMCGSGTVLQQSLIHGHLAIGFDKDPLAVLISRVSGQPIEPPLFLKEAYQIADQAEALREQRLQLPWIDRDDETQAFISFWFGSEQRKTLRALSYLAARRQGRIKNALRLAISKIIITKEPKASLARDTSHSRPHRVKTTSEYDVISGFRRAATEMAAQMERSALTDSVTVNQADARKLPGRLRNQADIVVTSPPYGNAIDYLRGHRLSLVWLGYTIPQLRAIRSGGIGTERGSGIRRTNSVVQLASELGPVELLESSTKLRLYRFARDIRAVLKQIYCVLKPQGRAVLVIGNSTIKGVFVNNARLILAAATQVGFVEVSRCSREIPANHRYLPPPKPDGDQPLAKRIREEVVLTLQRVN